MFHHMFSHVFDVSKETNMTKLIDLIKTDRLDAHLFFNRLQIGL